MNIKKSLGSRIKELRKQRNLSQEKLAELVDISQNALSYIETGDNFCTSETIEKLIAALGIDADELFDFGHQKDNDTLLIEINKMLKNTPEKIPEVYKIIKAIIN